MTPDEIAQIHAACFPDRPWNAQDIGALLSQPATTVFTAPGAFLILQVVAPEAEIMSLGTCPKLRRTGRAHSLLLGASETLRQSGVTDMFLEVAADNKAALRLYLGLGFTETGRRANYYHRPGGQLADAVLMRAALPLGHGGARPPA